MQRAYYWSSFNLEALFRLVCAVVMRSLKPQDTSSKFVLKLEGIAHSQAP